MQAMGCEQITAPGHRGYFNRDHVLSCESTVVVPVVPKTLTSNGVKRGLSTPHEFIYDVENDHYICSAGAKLTKVYRRVDHTSVMMAPLGSGGEPKSGGFLAIRR